MTSCSQPPTAPEFWRPGSGGTITWNLGSNTAGTPDTLPIGGGALAKTYRDDFGSASAVNVQSGGTWAGNVGSENWTNAWANGTTTFKNVDVDAGNMIVKANNDAAGVETLYRNVDLSGATSGSVVLYLYQNNLNTADQIKLQACTSTGTNCQELGNIGTTTGKKTFSLDAALAAITVGRIQFVQPLANVDQDETISLSSFEVRIGSGSFFDLSG